jgi:PST family polysaccharide transporter
VHGIAWTGGSRWITQIFNWAATIVVARILSPEDYGIVGMATVFIGLTALLTEFGLGSAVVALRSLSREQLAQLNSLAVILGAAGTLVSLAAAFPISWLFRSPAVVPVVMALSSTLLIDSLRSVPGGVLAKEMRFKLLAMVEALKGLIVSGITVVLALTGAGYWSLVIAIILSSVFPTVFMVVRHSMPFRRPRRQQLMEAIDYTKNFTVSYISWYAYSNADFVVAGRVLGPAPLGDYTLAWTLASAPIDRIAGAINRVLPPLYSAVSDDNAALRRYLLKITQGMSLIVFPASIGLALVSSDFILSVLGTKWTGVVAPLRILAFYGLLQTLSLVTSPVLMVTGNARTAARLGMASAVILPAGFVAGALAYGTVGIAAVWITLFPAVLFVRYRVVFRVIEMDARVYFRALVPGAFSSGCMVVSVLAFSAASTDFPPLVMLITKVVVGATAYSAVLYVGWRRSLTDMLDAIKALK